MILEGDNKLKPHHIEDLGNKETILEDQERSRKALTVENIKQALKNNNDIKKAAATELGYSREHFSRIYHQMRNNGKL